MGKKQADTTFGKQAARELSAACLSAGSLESAADIIESVADKILQEITARGQYTAKGNLAGLAWVKNFRKLAAALRNGRAAFKVFNKGNSKLPFYSYSELPEFTCPGAGACLQFCYSFTGWRYPQSFARQLQNTLLMKYKRSVIAGAFHAIRENKKGATIIRLYVDGDIANIGVLGFWFQLLQARPQLQAYGYSKSWEVFQAWAAQSLPWPQNYVLNLSSGSRYDTDTKLKAQLAGLPITRGEFIAVPIVARVAKGFKRFQDKAYHIAVREAGRVASGNSRVFSCPGQCGACLPNGQHACGLVSLSVPIAIGEHN